VGTVKTGKKNIENKSKKKAITAFTSHPRTQGGSYTVEKRATADERPHTAITFYRGRFLQNRKKRILIFPKIPIFQRIILLKNL
jgi:hypothetical protein